MDTADKCGNCKFFLGDLEPGQCVRYPPVMVSSTYSSDRGVRTAFPQIHRDKWCGEWKTKPKGLRDFLTPEEPSR